MAGLIGVYGGSFNPPHTGHMEAAKTALRFLGLDKIVFVPSNIPPHKQLTDGVPSGDTRAKLLELCLGNAGWAEISRLEIERGGVSYTSDTLCQLKELLPESELYLLVGTDMFVSLETWHDAEQLLRNVHIAVFSRMDGESGEIYETAKRYEDKYGARIDVVPNKAIEISSTALREALRERGGTEYLSPEEYAYIIKQRLYDAKPDYNWLREQAYAMLKPKRIPHVQGTEKVAQELAELYGEDVDDAKTAAILHDITKKLDLSEQLLLCKEYGIIIDDLEQTSEKLLHSKTGAYLSRDKFGISDRVFEAIRWHTTGKGAMTLLEKIIYIADYIEPTRDFDGVEELRRLAYKDIDAAMLLGLKMSEQDLMERGVPIHESSREATEYYERLAAFNNLEEKIQ